MLLVVTLEDAGAGVGGPFCRGVRAVVGDDHDVQVRIAVLEAVHAGRDGQLLLVGGHDGHQVWIGSAGLRASASTREQAAQRDE